MRLKTISKPMPEINMIPMIDVIFMLLIFFLVATQMKNEEYRTDVQLPDSVEALINLLKDKVPAPLDLTIVPASANGRTYMVNGLEASKEELAEVLRWQGRVQWQRGGERASVRIRCDKRAEFIELQRALKACQEAEVIQVYIAAEHRSS
jgi:biopolymer transport protein ExbD